MIKIYCTVTVFTNCIYTYMYNVVNTVKFCIIIAYKLTTNDASFLFSIVPKIYQIASPVIEFLNIINYFPVEHAPIPP